VFNDVRSQRQSQIESLVESSKCQKQVKVNKSQVSIVSYRDSGASINSAKQRSWIVLLDIDITPTNNIYASIEGGRQIKNEEDANSI
jgi:hypothetical protein